jgi:hypothetical protein
MTSKMFGDAPLATYATGLKTFNAIIPTTLFGNALPAVY